MACTASGTRGDRRTSSMSANTRTNRVSTDSSTIIRLRERIGSDLLQLQLRRSLFVLPSNESTGRGGPTRVAKRARPGGAKRLARPHSALPLPSGLRLRPPRHLPRHRVQPRCHRRRRRRRLRRAQRGCFGVVDGDERSLDCASVRSPQRRGSASRPSASTFRRHLYDGTKRGESVSGALELHYVRVVICFLQRFNRLPSYVESGDRASVRARARA